MAVRSEDALPVRPEGDPTRRIPAADAADIGQLAETAAGILRDTLEAALEPATSKVLRRWNLGEVVEWLGVSRKSIERGIEDGSLPGGERTKSGRRMFSLEEMHRIQEVLGLRPWRNPATDPLITIAIANFKGGVAKTSTSVHLAQYLALKGYRVLAIDIDAQGSLTTLFGLRPDADVKPGETLSPYLRGPLLENEPGEYTGTLATAIRPTYWHGLDLIAANLQLYGAEFSLSARQNKEPNFRFYRVLADGIKTIEHNYDVVVIDTPPSLNYLTTAAIYAANGLIMPVPPAVMDFASSVSFFQLLAELLEVTNSNEAEQKRFDFLGLLISKFEARNPIHSVIHDWLRAAFSRRVLMNTMSQSNAVRIGPDMRTAYEIDRYDGSRRTLTRALEHLNAINGEIEDVIRAQWPSKQLPAPSRRRGSRT